MRGCWGSFELQARYNFLKCKRFVPGIVHELGSTYAASRGDAVAIFTSFVLLVAFLRFFRPAIVKIVVEIVFIRVRVFEFGI